MKLRLFSKLRSQECLNVTRIGKNWHPDLFLPLPSHPMMRIAREKMHEFDETRWTSISRQSQKPFQSLILVFLYTVVVVAEKRGKPFQDDKKSNKSFSYSRHGQNYEHFLLPFPSFSNQSCWLIPKVFQLKLEIFQVFRVQIERIPNCQTHHVRQEEQVQLAGAIINFEWRKFLNVPKILRTFQSSLVFI